VRSWRRTPVATPPHIVGYAAAGTVEAVGPEVTDRTVGQRMAAFGWSGSHAELFAVAAHHTYPVPDGLDAAVAATVPVAFGTADEALFECGALRKGETVLVRGATGGVGLAAVQLAAAAGATVVATASGAERAAAVRRLGATHVVDHREGDFVDAVLAATDGSGVDLTLDLVGGPGFDALPDVTCERGRIVVAGAASGDYPSIAVGRITLKSLTLTGLLFGRVMHLPRVHAMLARHLSGVAAGDLTMPIDRVFPLAEAAAAHEHVGSGRPLGRVILRP
jgi:NADPH:quinone reductase-like Zn-dependent oxidoreductase